MLFYHKAKAGTPPSLPEGCPQGAPRCGNSGTCPSREALHPVADGPRLNTISLDSRRNGNYLKLALVCILHWILFYSTLSRSLGTA